nr:ribonuclease H-like domain-containing protein [Tanacetum cinerariifolium]
HVVPAAVLTRSKHVPITTVRPATTAIPKTSVTRPKQAKTVVTKTNSPPQRHINHSPSLKANNFPPKVTAVKAPMVNAAQIQVSNGLGPKEKLTILFLVRGNPQHALKDKEVIDSGCSRHMTGNMYYLSDFEELNGGYVAFGGNPKGGTFMPPKPDLVFNNAPNDVETDHSAFTVKLCPTRPDQDLSHTHRPSAPIIKDWVSDSEDESETKTP